MHRTTGPPAKFGKGCGLVVVAVVGSRSLAGVSLPLGSVVPPSVSLVVSGGARGVDSAAASWARARGVPVREFLPNYSLFGRAAPLVRNREIIEAADLVLAFWDGCSRGTLHAVHIARELGKPVRLFRLRK